ncbi:MAG TPA: ComEC/Rec2 family competence protein, partial [Alphaproteobacteria bacterium]
MITHSSLDPFGMQPHLHKNPQPAGLLLLWWPVFLSIGIGWYFCLSRPPAPLVGLSALAGIIALGGATRRWRYHDVWRWVIYGLFAMALGFTLIQFQTDRITIEPLRYPSFGRPLQGTIESAEYVRGGWRVVLNDTQLEPDPRYLKYWRASDGLKRYRIRVTVRSRDFHPAIGDRIRLNASLIAPSGELLPGMFNFQRHAFYQEFSGYGYSNTPVELLTPAPDEFHGLEHYRQYIAQRVKGFLLQHTFDHPQSVIGLTTALLNGQRAGIDKQGEQDMQRSGLQHLISISGFHVSLLAAIVFFTVRFLLALSMQLALRLPIKKIAAFVALLAIIMYMLIVGMSAPTVRSVLMTGVVLVAVMLDREAITLRLVAIAAALILIIQPDSLVTPGFQMSFAAVTALVVFYQKTLNFWQLPFWRDNIFYRVLFILLGSVATTLVASIATAPLAVYHFQQLPMLSVIANVLVTPIMAFIVMPASL